jgi:hypothetical protein
MAIDKALIDRLLTNYKKLEDIIGENGKTAGKFCSPHVLVGKQSAPDFMSGVRISNSRDPRSRHLDSQLFHFPDSRHTRGL